MSWAVSVVCRSCQAPLKVTKPSLLGKWIACPSCKKPFLIQSPGNEQQSGAHGSAPQSAERAARRSERSLLQHDDIPLIDGPLPVRDARVPLSDDDALPLLDDTIPLQDERVPAAKAAKPAKGVTSAFARPAPANKSAHAVPAAPSTRRASKSSDTVSATVSGTRPAETTQPRRPRVASDAETAEFNAMLMETEGDDEESDYPRPQSHRKGESSRKGSGRGAKSAALEDTSEYDCLADTEEQTIELPSIPPLTRRKTGKTAPKQKTEEEASETFEVRDPDQPTKAGGSSRRRKKKRRTSLPGSRLVIGAGAAVLLCAAYYYSNGTDSPRALPPLNRRDPVSAAPDKSVPQPPQKQIKNNAASADTDGPASAD